MNLRKGESTGISPVGWMTTQGIDDCNRYARTASMADLLTAQKHLRTQSSKTRLGIVNRALKKRFGVVTGAALLKKGAPQS